MGVLKSKHNGGGNRFKIVSQFMCDLGHINLKPVIQTWQRSARAGTSMFPSEKKILSCQYKNLLVHTAQHQVLQRVGLTSPEFALLFFLKGEA